jgi:hypothetical protein
MAKGVDEPLAEAWMKPLFHAATVTKTTTFDGHESRVATECNQSKQKNLNQESE